MQQFGKKLKGFHKIVISAAIGGTASEIGGGKFANGAISGAFVQMYNENQHMKTIKKRVEVLMKRYEELSNRFANADWKAVSKGFTMMAASTAGFVASAAAMSTGVGTVPGAFGMAASVAGVGFGMSKVMNGLGYGEYIGGGVCEAVDLAVGGDGASGQILDVLLGGVPSTVPQALITTYSVSELDLFQYTALPSSNYVQPLIPMDNTNVGIPREN